MESRFGEDDLRSRKTVSMRLAALDAKSSARMGSSRSGTMQGGGHSVLIVFRTISSLRENHFGTAELRWLVGQQSFSVAC